MKNKIKIVDGTSSPVAATLAISFMEKSEECIRRVARSKNRTYRSLISALNDGMAMKDIIPPISTVLLNPYKRLVQPILLRLIIVYEKMV